MRTRLSPAATASPSGNAASTELDTRPRRRLGMNSAEIVSATGTWPPSPKFEMRRKTMSDSTFHESAVKPVKTVKMAIVAFKGGTTADIIGNGTPRTMRREMRPSGRSLRANLLAPARAQNSRAIGGSAAPNNAKSAASNSTPMLARIARLRCQRENGSRSSLPTSSADLALLPLTTYLPMSRQIL